MSLPTGLLPDTEIAYLAERGMISPFSARTESPCVISYGLSSYGYDARLADEIRVVKPVARGLIDPKHASSLGGMLRDAPDARDWLENADLHMPAVLDNVPVIPPLGFALAHTIETFSIPRDVLVICLGKSTYARCGLIVNVTPLEPGWSGQVTLELHNTTPAPIAVYPGEGICQFLFLRGAREPAVSYADRGGKYQGQRDVTLPRMPTEWVDAP